MGDTQNKGILRTIGPGCFQKVKEQDISKEITSEK
jgi:hypothetical protein